MPKTRPMRALVLAVCSLVLSSILILAVATAVSARPSGPESDEAVVLDQPEDGRIVVHDKDALERSVGWPGSGYFGGRHKAHSEKGVSIATHPVRSLMELQAQPRFAATKSQFTR